MPESTIPALPPARPKTAALPPAHRHQSRLARLGTSERLGAMFALLARNRFFQHCRREELQFLAATAYPVTFEPGDALCVEGTWASHCFVVAGGHAVVTIDHEDVGDVSSDDVVGERGVLFDTARAATVTADAFTVACAIPRERLETLVEDNRAVRRWMLEDVRAHYPRLGRS